MGDSTSLGARCAVLAISLGAHAALALAVVHEGSASLSLDPPRGSPAELAAPELEPIATSPPAAAPGTRPRPAAQSSGSGADIRPNAHEHAPLSRITEPRSVPKVALAGQVASGTDLRELVPAAAPHFAMIVARSTRSSLNPARGLAGAAPSVASATPPAGRSGIDGDPGSSPPGSLDSVLPESAVDVPARLISGDPPAYTAAAQSAGIEASVPLEIVIDPRGEVTSVRILQHVGYGLDEAARDGIRNYRFDPARRAGKPVAVRMRMTVRFQFR